jgi:hypothetical protein
MLTLLGTIALSLVNVGTRLRAHSRNALTIAATIILTTLGSQIDLRAQSPDGHALETIVSAENGGSSSLLQEPAPLQPRDFLPETPELPATAGISSFDSYRSGSSLLGLRWETEREEGTMGFRVERALSGSEGKYQWTEVAYVPGHWDSPVGRFYVFVDDTRNFGSAAGASVLYRLKQIGRDGEVRYSNPLKVAVSSKSARTSLRHD